MTDSARDDGLLATYRQLLAKVDAKFQEIRGKHSGAFACRHGCHGCCQPGLTVNRVERDHIAAFLAHHPDRTAAVTANAAAAPWQGTRCLFLDARGACGIYEVRPVVCRSHGAPTKVKEGDTMVLDVCPLNFTGEESLSSLPEIDVINLETLTTLLTIINIRYQGDETSVRFALSPDLSPVHMG